MRKEEKMRKKIVGFIIAGILVLVFGFASIPARAELSLGIVGGYYSPNFGWINDYYFDYFNDWRNTDLGFKAGKVYGLILEYDVNSHFRLRIEYNRFGSKTSDDWWDYSAFPWTSHHDVDYKLTVSPVILSGIYKFSPFYVGAGVASFSTEFQDAYICEDYFGGVLVKTSSQSYSASDSPIGILVLGGFEYGDEPFFGGMEARYVIAEANLETEYSWRGAKADLSGFQVCVKVGYKFK